MQWHWEDWAQNKWTGQYHKLKVNVGLKPKTILDDLG